jgi:hypothetical protein
MMQWHGVRFCVAGAPVPTSERNLCALFEALHTAANWATTSSMQHARSVFTMLSWWQCSDQVRRMHAPYGTAHTCCACGVYRMQRAVNAVNEWLIPRLYYSEHVP